MKHLDALFYPGSIAIVGASNDISKPGGSAPKTLVETGYKGKIYPVNKNKDIIHGLPCFPSISSIPGDVDLVLIAVPSKNVMPVLRESSQAGIKAAIILTSGFSEIGSKGQKMQQEITKLAYDKRMLICGPNSQGIFNGINGMSAGFGITEFHHNLTTPDFFGFISQSGGFGTSAYMLSAETHVGLTFFVSSGNEADVKFYDYITFMVKDPVTKVISGYLEGVQNGRKLFEAADLALQAQKPIVLIKSGRHAAAAKAASSHTGSMVGSEKVYNSFFHQKAVIRADGIEELSAIISLFARQKLPEGNRVCVVAASGGSGVLISDQCAEAGLNVIPLSEDTREKLNEILPGFGSSANPIDTTAKILLEPEMLSKSMGIVIDAPEVDMILIEYWFIGRKNYSVLDEIIKAASMTEKPVIVSMLDSEFHGCSEIQYLRERKVPAVRSQRLAARALGALSRYSGRVRKIQDAKNNTVNFPKPDRKKVSRILNDIPPGDSLSESLAKEVLTAYNIPCSREILATNPDIAVEKAREIGFPVVLKIESKDILHKTEAGGVKLNIKSPVEVRKAYEEILESAIQYKPGAKIKGVLVQEMLPGKRECIVGISRDRLFGPTVVFGLGGIFVEALEDISLRICPITLDDAKEMIAQIRGNRLLKGFRGTPPADIHAIAEIIYKVSCLAIDFPEINEMDINPLFAYDEGKGACVADALIIT